MVIITFIPAVMIGLIVLMIAGLRVNDKKEGEEMLKNIYHYLVVFATLMMIVGGSIGVFMSVADLISPATYYQSFEDYKQMNREDKGENQTTAKSEEELRASYEAMIEQEEEQSKKRAMNSLIKSFGWIIIPLPIFIYFQRQLKKRE